MTPNLRFYISFKMNNHISINLNFNDSISTVILLRVYYRECFQIYKWPIIQGGSKLLSTASSKCSHSVSKDYSGLEKFSASCFCSHFEDSFLFKTVLLVAGSIFSRDFCDLHFLWSFSDSPFNFSLSSPQCSYNWVYFSNSSPSNFQLFWVYHNSQELDFL